MNLQLTTHLKLQQQLIISHVLMHRQQKTTLGVSGLAI